MRYLLILGSMLLVSIMLCGGCRVSANTPEDEQLGTGTEQPATGEQPQEPLQPTGGETTPTGPNLGQPGGGGTAPPAENGGGTDQQDDSGDQYPPEIQEQVDALYAEIGAIEDQIRDANDVGDQGLIDELQRQREDLLNQLSVLIGKPTTEGDTSPVGTLKG